LEATGPQPLRRSRLLQLWFRVGRLVTWTACGQNARSQHGRAKLQRKTVMRRPRSSWAWGDAGPCQSQLRTNSHEWHRGSPPYARCHDSLLHALLQFRSRERHDGSPEKRGRPIAEPGSCTRDDWASRNFLHALGCQVTLEATGPQPSRRSRLLQLRVRVDRLVIGRRHSWLL
jgi:hypothetical protein